MPAYRTKKGKHGTLYRYRLHLRSTDPAEALQSHLLWAYCLEHAEEKCIEALDPMGWTIDLDYTITRIERVRA